MKYASCSAIRSTSIAMSMSALRPVASKTSSESRLMMRPRGSKF
jgi:hypothetical protein